MAFTFYTKDQTDTLLADYLTSASASATYLTSATASATYLPKSGGTITGDLEVQGRIIGGTSISNFEDDLFVVNDSAGASLTLTLGTYLCWIIAGENIFNLGFLMVLVREKTFSPIFTIYDSGTKYSCQLAYDIVNQKVFVYKWTETAGEVTLTPYTDTFSTTMTICFRKIT